MLHLPIYLDNHRHPPSHRPRVVVEAIFAVFLPIVMAMPASRGHVFFWLASCGRRRQGPRSQVADLIGASAKEIVFTSGATESNNLALKRSGGQLSQNRVTRLLSAPSNTLPYSILAGTLRDEGLDITILPVDGHGPGIRGEPSRSHKLPRDHSREHPGKPTMKSALLQPLSDIGKTVQRTTGSLPYRRGTGSRQNCPRRLKAMGIDLLTSVCPQDVWAQRSGSALCPPSANRMSICSHK